ncbi:hypothetical protein PPL_04789 [Heterostelium album PN500]|uniref:Uncharacterized protein n=1 Tax=Heterostelium pallidum (strain ATCC 26659 / Pp 5 / PN500) TaxID=670386 RepID=D3B8J6_HETP5|nr:hypothetical protein PPL_04789 [Heterostelium album PN500]EFA82364.1 hypothetical protein PPL_04789 [Heterostelium album PN500]|eukprot:XP_020434481.1 hypothetical protein PPL_04789 [Heterostelium album PN500]
MSATNNHSMAKLLMEKNDLERIRQIYGSRRQQVQQTTQTTSDVVNEIDEYNGNDEAIANIILSSRLLSDDISQSDVCDDQDTIDGVSTIEENDDVSHQDCFVIVMGTTQISVEQQLQLQQLQPQQQQQRTSEIQQRQTTQRERRIIDPSDVRPSLFEKGQKGLC